MREILFRGKRLGIGDWVHGFLQDRKTPFQIELGDSQWYIFVTPENPDDSYVFYQVDPETAGQYTGMKDKARKRIFEGDIIKAVMNGGNYDQFEFPTGQVVFENGAFCLRDRRETTPLCSFAPAVSFEIIGNIYDNPELLGGTE